MAEAVLNANEIGLTLRIKGFNVLRARWWLAGHVLRLAGWVAGCDVEVEASVTHEPREIEPTDDYRLYAREQKTEPGLSEADDDRAA